MTCGKMDDNEGQESNRGRRSAAIAGGIGVGLAVGLVLGALFYVLGVILWMRFLAPGTTGDSAFSLSLICALPWGIIIGSAGAAFSGVFIYKKILSRDS